MDTQRNGLPGTRLPREPKALLAVVEDERGRQWYRWSAGDAHTGYPWAVLGAVHADTVSSDGYECMRWDELPPVVMVSAGVTRDSFVAEVMMSDWEASVLAEAEGRPTPTLYAVPPHEEQ